METNSSGDTSSEPKEFENFCIRQYVAEIRRKDWKKCCPFNLSSYSPESNYQAERVFASLILEDNNALINTPENTPAPNFLTYSEVRNPEGQAAVSETHTGVVIGNDATSIINHTTLESASGNVIYAHCEIEKIIYGDMLAAENEKPEDVVVVDHSLKDIIADGASKSSSCKLKDDVQYQNDKPEDVVVVDDSLKDIIADGASKSSSRKLKNDVQYQNDKPEDVVVIDDSLKDILADGTSKSSSRKLKDDVKYQNDKPEDVVVVDDSLKDIIADGASKSSSRKRKDDVQYQNDKPEDVVVVDDSLKDIIADGASKSSSRKLKNDVQYQNDKPEDVVVIDDSLKDILADGTSKSSSRKLKDDVKYQNDKPEDVVVVDDSLKDIIADGASKSSSRKLKDDVQYQNDKPEDVVVVDDSLKDIIADGASNSSSRKLKNDVQYQNDKPEDVVVIDDSLKDILANGTSKSSSHKLKDDVKYQNDKPEDVVVVDDSLKDINDGPSKSSSLKLKDDVQYQNENSVSEDIIAAGNEKHIVVDDDWDNTNSDEERNLAGEKPQKFRQLSDILKQLKGPCDAVSASYVDSDFSSESEEDDSDDFTLDTFVRKKKGVRVNSKSDVASKKKKRSCEVREQSFVRAKRMKPVPADSCGKDSELGSKRQLRKTRTDEVDLWVMNKHKKSSAEIIVRGSTSGSQNVAPSSLGPGENRSETEKDSVISCGNKRKRETIQNDRARDVSKFLDRSQRRFTEENRSRSTHGVNSVQLVQLQPTIATLNSIETASGCVQKSIRENSPPVDNESMAALQLLRLFNSGVTTHTSSKTAAKDPAVSVSNGEIPCGIDGNVPPASGSIVDQSHEEFNVINDAGLPQAEQVESGTSVCVMNVNPSEFSILNAKKYMRRVKVIQK